MRKFRGILIIFTLLGIVAPSLFAGDAPSEKSFLRQITRRDSVLIADQLQYGVLLEGVSEGSRFALPDWSGSFRDSVEVLSQWILDTVRVNKARKDREASYDIEARIVVASFDEGSYELPPIYVLRESEGGIDTTWFASRLLEVKTIPIDTTTFEVHDIKGQIRYPVTFKEVLPYLLVALALVLVILLVICLVVRRQKMKEAEALKEPPHVVALRKLDKWRSNKFWAPERQKAFYSGVTDILREYIVARYDVGAMEMTTAEIFSELKKTDIPTDLYLDLKELFERSDLIKYAKMIVGDEENARVLPLSVRFVTTTYQAEIEEELEVVAETGTPVQERKPEERDDSAYMPK